MKKYSFFLDEEEARAIHVELARLGKNQLDLAKEINQNPSSIGRYLKGTYRISPNTATAIYECLGKSQNIEFLMQYQEIPPAGRGQVSMRKQVAPTNPVSSSIANIEQSWLRMYDAYAQRIRLIFGDAPLETKGKIIANLEKIIDDHGKRREK